MLVCMCVCMYVWMCVCINTYMYNVLCISMHVCMCRCLQACGFALIGCHSARIRLGGGERGYCHIICTLDYAHANSQAKLVSHKFVGTTNGTNNNYKLE